MSAATAAFLRSGRGVAGDGCAASHFQPRLLLMAELAQISDAGAGDPGICNGPVNEPALAGGRYARGEAGGEVANNQLIEKH